MAIDDELSNQVWHKHSDDENNMTIEDRAGFRESAGVCIALCGHFPFRGHIFQQHK